MEKQWNSSDDELMEIDLFIERMKSAALKETDLGKKQAGEAKIEDLILTWNRYAEMLRENLH